MNGLPPGTRIWLAAGVTDMHCGFNSLAAIGRRYHLFAGADIEAWLRQVLAAIADRPVNRVDEFPPLHFIKQFAAIRPASLANSGRRFPPASANSSAANSQDGQDRTLT